MNGRFLARLLLPFVVLSGSAQPGSAQPGNLQPGNLQPGNLQPGNLQPGNLQPGSAQPASAQPASAQPGSNQSARALSADVDLPGPAELDRLAAESVGRWEASPHGQMLLRILPRGLEPSALPEPQSAGARLTALYCVQCHHLPNPAMHDAGSWPRIVERMIPRMRGEGNMGALMATMMRGPGGKSAAALVAPNAGQTQVIIDYLERHAMQPLDPGASPTLRTALSGSQGRMFVEACNQCHVLPDPAAHSADEWPAVVDRMAQNMQWMNRIASTPDDPREPQLRLPEITDFLRRHAGDSAGMPDSPRLR